MSKWKSQIVFFIAVIFGIIGFLCNVQASTTNGTIDTTNKYVWASKVGWINFGPTNGGVTVTDSSLSGYIWSEQSGWINLSPTNGGVVNDSEGNLSGYAWGKNLGWINFTGVIINSSGKFTGTAFGDNVGTINFDCTNCNVSTDWRPASSRVSVPSTNNTSGGGGIVASSAPLTYSLSINNGKKKTNSLAVKLYLRGDSKTVYVWLSEDPNLLPAQRISYQSIDGQMIYDFNLTGSEGVKTVYAKFCNNQGYCGKIISDSINYIINSPDKIVVTTSSLIQPINQVPSSQQLTDKQSTDHLVDNDIGIGNKVVNTIKQIASKINLLIPDFLKPWKNAKGEKLEDVRQYVSKDTPLAFKGTWELLPKDPIQQYVFAPLPADFTALAKNIPSIGNLFSNVGIKNMQDLRKLADTQITIPSLSKIVGVSSKQSSSSLLENLSNNLKMKVPTDMVFARSGNRLVDFSTVLSLSVNGQPVQKLKTISGKKLSLSIKPKFSARSVKGYLTFVSHQNSISYNANNNLWQKLGLVETTLAADNNLLLTGIENKMILAQFDYEDKDGDGIYTAEVSSPVSAGQYEVLTVIEYQDSQLGNKLVRLVTVVDPEGYVYENIKGKELRIPNALVSLYWLNKQTKQYELWPAQNYQQQNGQVTDSRGSYSFLVPPGTYYLQAQATGYKDYKSAVFKVDEGDGVHMNIELQSKSWWTMAWDWRTWIIGLLVMLLLYMIEKEVKSKKINIKY